MIYTYLRRNHAFKRARIFLILLLVALTIQASLLQNERAAANSTYHALCNAGTLTAFTQNWSDAGLITANDDWSGVPSIIGYRGDDLVTTTGNDPQGVLADGTGTPVDVNANRSDPSTYATGGIAEFDGIVDPVVAFQGSSTADVPFLLIHLNTTSATSIRIQYILRDIDADPGVDASVQRVALHYRVGTSGNFTNLGAGYVANANQAGATAVNAIDVTLPAAADNQAQVQVRVMTTNAVGNDAFIGVDDINITATCSSADGAPAVSGTTPVNAAADVAVTSDISIVFNENVNVSAAGVSLECPAGTPIAFTGLPANNVGSVTLNPSADLPTGTACAVTVLASEVTDADSNDPPDSLAADYTIGFTTAGPLGSCPSATVTTVGAIQGIGVSSPLSGTRTIRGVVTGYYDNPSGANDGLFVQNVGTTDVNNGGNDSNPASSDGIFVYVNPLPSGVAIGDSVQVTGAVGESFGLTRIGTSGISATVAECGAFGTVAATPITLPMASATSLEVYEGMLVSLSQTLHVTEHYQLFQFGQFVVSSGGRLYQPTHLYPPSTDPTSSMKVMEANNALNQIMIDDRSDETNPNPVVFPTGNLSATNTLRIGDTVTAVEGPLHYAFSRFRVQPNSITFGPSNPRPTAAPTVPGEVRIVATNLLNYFNGDGAGGGFPTSRGANDAAEFARQRGKTINMLCALNADVVGLIELENDVDSAADGITSAIEDLVAGLNTAPYCGPYSYIETGLIGTDAIRVGLIHRATVQPVGSFAVLDSVAPFNVNTRPPLAQTFSYNGQLFTVIVNHFKSKGCAGTPAPTGANADLGDGQSCWNADRVAAAGALLNWLATDPTASGDPDFLIVGDLNSYAEEDPITHLRIGGYTNLIDSLLGDAAYSYVFSAQSGYLDHALASASLTSQVAGVAEWHINADEPSALDYNTEYGKPASFYESGAFRISDHDPVIVGLNLTGTVIVDTSTPTPISGGAPSGAPGISIQDPALSKIGELAPGAVGLPGEQLTWTITITNTGTAAATNVVAIDVLRSELRPEQATTILGSVSISGQTVTITVPTLNAGQSAVVQLVTTVVSSPADNLFINELSVSGNGLQTRTARGVVTSLAGTRLPSTGYGQPDNTPYLILFAGGLLVLLSISRLFRRRSA